jgi:8-oxo-dGTP pyrophosphatase MutT (NUDIX family)
MTESGFSIESDSIVHKWAMFRLVRRVASSPRGETFERTFVSTPGAVATVAVTDDGDVLLVSQYRASLGEVIQEIPAGMRDIEGEDPAVTAVRELKEETGYVSTAIEFLGTCLSSPGVTDSSVDVYLATGLRAGASEPHGPEEDEMTVETVSFAEALRRVDTGEITDAKTAFGLLLAARRHPHLVR